MAVLGVLLLDMLLHAYSTVPSVINLVFDLYLLNPPDALFQLLPKVTGSRVMVCHFLAISR